MSKKGFFAICLLVAGLAALRFAAAAPEQAIPNTMAERVRACVGCHGPEGSGVENVYFPHLAGKPAGYLYNQLVAFRDGRRKYAPMNYLLAYLPDPYLKRMAEYFADQDYRPQQSPTSASGEVLELGETIANEGLPDKDVPACIACHGAALNGREPGIPGLLGLRADYLSAQLGAWRYGTRTALAPDCMQIVAARLSEEEVSAVAAWIASLPVRAELRPLPAGAQALPLECGSQEVE